MLTVEVQGQRNDPPRTYSYADIYGQRTVEADFWLAGESLSTFDQGKHRRFETILQSMLHQDPTLAVVDDGVNILTIAAAKFPLAISTGGDGGGKRKLLPDLPGVQIKTDIAMQNAKVAETLVSWLKNSDHLLTFQNYLKTASINAVSLSLVGTEVSETIYCSAGSQPQEIAPKEFTCVPCPVGFYQPLRSKQACPACPVGTCRNPHNHTASQQHQRDALRTACLCVARGGVQQHRHPAAGAAARLLAGDRWARGGPGRPLLPEAQGLQVQPAGNLPRSVTVTTDCVARTAAWTGCRAKCLTPASLGHAHAGGPYSNCTAGHQQGSPLCAVCEPGFYQVNGYCTQCGNRRSIAVTLYLLLAVAILIFLVLLYAFVRPGNDIDEATDAIKDQVTDGPGPKAFAAANMRHFLSDTVRACSLTAIHPCMHALSPGSGCHMTVSPADSTTSCLSVLRVPRHYYSWRGICRAS